MGLTAILATETNYAAEFFFYRGKIHIRVIFNIKVLPITRVRYLVKTATENVL